MSEQFLSSLPEDERHAFVEGVFDLARTGQTAQLREMIQAGVPEGIVNGRGDTLLIIATYAQQHETVQYLLEARSPLNAVNSMGQTAVSCAVFRNDALLLNALLDAGADPQAGTHSALAIAQQFNITAMIELLNTRSE
ncbi:ankyrin repeat domain-containing protein [Timonella senegalensis]|jgi:ankyrin repeat protein|uniref:ankyrin repeat domain-containing protein n=1 Tax=Timonella senegalensis TaxID=1465825 RepID=UPI0028B20162|nr:ankyrin repeat domain-containing protein [Timonella senegalensis]